MSEKRGGGEVRRSVLLGLARALAGSTVVEIDWPRPGTGGAPHIKVLTGPLEMMLKWFRMILDNCLDQPKGECFAPLTSFFNICLNSANTFFEATADLRAWLRRVKSVLSLLVPTVLTGGLKNTFDNDTVQKTVLKMTSKMSKKSKKWSCPKSFEITLESFLDT